MLGAKGEGQKALTALGSDGQDWGLGLRPRSALTYFLPWAPESFELKSKLITTTVNLTTTYYAPDTILNTLHFFFFFFLDCVACETLVLRPGIKPRPLALEVWGLNHWTTREVQHSIIK